MMSSPVMNRRRSVMSCGWASWISAIFSQLVMNTAQVNPSRSPRVTSRMAAPGSGSACEAGSYPKTKTPGAGAPGFGRAWWPLLDLDDVRGSRALRAVDDVEPHLVALVERPEPLGPDLGMVDEDVRTTLT